MNLELNLDRLLPPALLSIFSVRNKPIEKTSPVIVEVHPDINEKVSKILKLSKEIYYKIRENGDKPYGDMWAEVHFSTPETSYWIQAGDEGSLIINTESNEERHSLRIETNNLSQPISHSEIRDIETSELKKEESIIDPENYSYDGLYEACRLLRKCDSLISKFHPPILVESSDIFSARNDILKI